MKQTNRPKTDNFAWISALLFPKKNKPNPAPSSGPVSTPPPISSAPASAPRPSASPAAVKAASPAEPKPRLTFKPANLLPAFWTVASGLSFLVNVILIVTLIILGQQLFALKKLVGENLIGGLYENFILMDQAHIKSNISVADDVPVNFSLTISQNTIVTLTEPTRINGAQVSLTSGGVAINSLANITLPAGTNLPVHLELTVPVDTTIPITLNVPVDIPLEKTELHKPFVGLQGVLSPYYWLLQPGIKSSSDLDACKPLSWLCNGFFSK